MRKFDIVVAVDEQLGIAKNGGMPWHLPGDVAHFKSLTTTTESSGRRNAVFMGRKTWESIPPRFRPLRDRINVVLCHNGVADLPPGVIVARGVEEAIDKLSDSELGRDVDRVFCVGGGEVYHRAIDLPACNRLYLTRVGSDYGCDTFFPHFEDRFERESIVEEGRSNGDPYRIEVWRRSR